MIEKKQLLGGLGVVTSMDVQVGQAIANLKPDNLNNFEYQFPYEDTVRIWDESIGALAHIRSNVVKHMNHSCNPNAVFKGFLLIAIANISKGTEVKFDYRATEKNIIKPFDCLCGYKYCGKRIE